MLSADIDAVQRVRDEARDLVARRLNDYEPGILAAENPAGCVLARQTRGP